MVAIDLASRRESLADVGFVVHIGLPHIEAVDGITLDPRTLVDFLQQHLQVLSVLLVAVYLVVVP